VPALSVPLPAHNLEIDIMGKVTTRAQRQALKRVFDRHVLARFLKPDNFFGERITEANYRAFRRTAQFECYGDALMVQTPSGMWLGIEPDGYTHS